MKFISQISSPDHKITVPHETKYHLLNKYILLFTLCGHILFIPVFFLLNRDIPFYNNLLCVFIDVLFLYLNSRWKLAIVHILYIVEITCHAFVSVIIFGSGAGFIYYFFPLTLYIFLLRKYNILKAVMFSVLMFLFVFQYFYLKLSAPEFPVTIIPVWLIYFLNAAASFSATAFTAAQFSVFVDTTEKTILNAKEKAEEGERAKSIFLANMSHEIRSPLNSINGMINLSLMSVDDDEKKQYLHIAKESADHMLTVINDILDYSKIEMRCMNLNIETFNLYNLIKNIMMAMDPSVYDKNLNMEYKISDDVPEIMKGDPSRIRQVLINLVSNAVKFTETGSIIVRCKNISHDDTRCSIEFSVQDSGIGIPEDKIDSVFNRFTQIDVKELKKYSGTGLGLAISKELIELMGGEISVESTPGSGSIFTFQIPLEKGAYGGENADMSDLISADREKRPLKVLIGEDIFTNWLLYEKYMQKLGHSFKIVANGNLVLDELERNSYDILLLDIEMPEMNGVETIKLIRNGDRGGHIHIPAIAMTGYYENDIKKNNSGFNGFLIKPVELEDLEKKINEIMLETDRSRLQEQFTEI